MVKIHNIRKLFDRRKELRKNQTPTEEKLWWYLKDKRLGVKIANVTKLEINFLLNLIIKF